MSDSIRVECRDRVATVLVDRPPLNILDLAALADFRVATERLATDDDLQLVVLTGAGERSFSAGVAVQDHTPDRIEEMLASFHSGLRALLELPVPSVAAIRGHCLGGGMELAACCDIRLAELGSTFGQPEIELGCYPPWAAAHYPALLGLAATTDLLLTGRTFDTDEAVRLGFVGRTCAAGSLDEALSELCDSITSKSAAVTRLAIRAIRARRDTGLAKALVESERIYTEELTQTSDMNEGLEAFLAKRPPRWQHR